MQNRFAFLKIICALLIFVLPSRAVEPWANKKMSVTNGLEIWLDASKEMAARAHLRNDDNIPERVAGLSLDVWHDASGNKRDVHQPFAEARPRFSQTSAGAAVHFGGTNDFLFASGVKQNLDATTIFILATPRSNKGGFGAFLALNREGANDYSAGLNVDMANGAKEFFDFVNIEGTGFIGIKNIMNSVIPFGEKHVLTIVAEPGTNVTDLRIDGVQQENFFRPTYHVGSAKVSKATNQFFGFDQITVGARFFSNTAEPPHAQGFLDGDISEVLVYDRILSQKERLAVEAYLKSKLVSKFPGRTLSLLSAVTNPPPVQMFLPGFAVRELPVTLNNINVVKYREDGKLVALGYDGNIWLLTDSDGDGVEDKVSAFWKTNTLRAPIGMALTPLNYPRGQGVFVASKGKLSLIVDTNRDDVADEEIIVATGWPGAFHQVDALGVAVDKDGSIFFGIGTPNFAGAYLIDKDTGKSSYSLKDERGTILKVAPDFSKREIVCTGIRFPVAMAFNSLGDLFCTDQEGATWLPNGNPFDELLYIEPGKHYGFPPRHPKHLPNVIDEPSVFDYSPQHQSTCGLNFNEPVNGGPIFGPAWWRGDALVAGESRGKLYRTKLAKTSAGYVALNQLIASLSVLTIDACVSPQGDLIVATHSGKPDWGSGPTGVGKLFKIFYTDKEASQPVAIWPASETETHIEFSRALDSTQIKDWTKRIAVTQGRYVSAGDPFEVMRPGYQAVQNQLLEPRYLVKVLSTALSADGKTLIIRTEPHREAVKYAVTIPRAVQPAKEKELPQEAQIDLVCDLTGVQADWQSSAGERWSGWLPHFDLIAAREFTKASATHAPLWSSLSKPGQLNLRGQLDLFEMLHASKQPGTKLDFKYPDETVTIVFKSKSPIQVRAPTMAVKRIGENEIHISAMSKKDEWFSLEVTLTNSRASEPSLDVSWFTDEDSRQRALPLRRILMPWATPESSGEEKIVERVIPEIAGGNWLRGQKLFLSEQTSCYKCHALGNSGAKIGPDLANLIHRDYASVLKDIVEPSAAINPDHVAYNVELKNGEVLTGVLVGADANQSRIADVTGKITTVGKNQIASTEPSTISLMPEGLLTALNEQQRKDLFTFLLMPPPLEPAPLEIKGEPPARKWTEVEALLNRSSRGEEALTKKSPMKIVLAAGPKDHGPSEHDYPLWQKRWSKLFGLAENLNVETALGWPSAKQFSSADVIVFYSNNPGWSVERASELDKFLNRGGGAVYIHFAVDGHDHCDELAQRIGLAWRGGGAKFRHGPLDLKFQPHEITKGFDQVHFVDESYWQLIGSETNIQLLASGIEEGKPRPLIWAREQGKGRVFVSIPGHYTWTFDDPLFRILILRGIAWTAHEPLDRFDPLVTIGARIGE